MVLIGGALFAQNVVSSYTPGSLRNDFTGCVGMKFVVGASGKTIDHLGALMSTGNTGTVTVRVLNSGGTSISNVAVDFTGGTAGTFYYASITPLALSASSTYYLMRQITTGGTCGSGATNCWADFGSVTLTSSFNSPVAIYDTSGTCGGSTSIGGAGGLYAGVDAQIQGGGAVISPNRLLVIR